MVNHDIHMSIAIAIAHADPADPIGTDVFVFEKFLCGLVLEVARADLLNQLYVVSFIKTVIFVATPGSIDDDIFVAIPIRIAYINVDNNTVTNDTRKNRRFGCAVYTPVLSPHRIWVGKPSPSGLYS